MKSRLIVLDVDGVMTDGTKMYGPDGSVIAKRYCDHDFTAINLFKEDGYKVCWLSADRDINEITAKIRGVDFWYSRLSDGTIDKVSWIEKLSKYYNIDPCDMIYVGDDIFDIPIMEAIKKVGGSVYCPSNAVNRVKAICCVLGKSGGHGAIMQLYDYIKGIPDYEDSSLR